MVVEPVAGRLLSNGIAGTGDKPNTQYIVYPYLVAIKSMPLRGIGLIQKATEISLHVIPITSILKVINSQHVFLFLK